MRFKSRALRGDDDPKPRASGRLAVLGCGEVGALPRTPPHWGHVLV